jgi:hypothetical protein
LTAHKNEILGAQKKGDCGVKNHELKKIHFSGI